jgi:hypothetical protein
VAQRAGDPGVVCHPFGHPTQYAYAVEVKGRGTEKMVSEKMSGCKMASVKKEKREKVEEERGRGREKMASEE